MSSEEIIFDVEERMEKAVEVFKHALSGIRTGRANPGLVDSMRVEVYGAPVILKSVAQVGAPEPTQIVIRPFDPGTIKDIEKAIRTSDLGFNPSNDGRVIRIAVPPLSTDVRRKLVSRIKEMGEDARVSVRNVRRDGNKAADDGEKGNSLTEDDCKQTKEKIQELTKQYENTINDWAKSKETEVMEQ